MSRGISFHTVGAATVNARLAKTVLHGGTSLINKFFALAFMIVVRFGCASVQYYIIDVLVLFAART